MSILDKFRRSASKAKDQADHVVEQHGDKIATGIEKTGEVASKVTGHRFDDKIDKGVNKAKERLEHHEDETPPGPASTTPEPAPEAPAASADPTPPPGDDADGPSKQGPTA
jgi:MT0933-like antitoxin protein